MSKRIKTKTLLECPGCNQRYTFEQIRLLPKNTYNQTEQKAQCHCRTEAFRLIIVDVTD